MAIKLTKVREETTHLGHVTLYRDELEKIVQAVAEISEPSIVGPGFEASSHEDFSDNRIPEDIGSLSIAAGTESAGIRVELERHRAVIHSVEPTMLMRGVVSSIEAATEPCRRSFHRSQLAKVVLPLTIFLPVAALLILAGLLWTHLIHIPMVPSAVDGALLEAAGLLVAVVVTTVVVCGARKTQRSSATIRNVYRVDRPNLWQRKREDVILQVALGLAFLLITIIFGALGFA